MGVICFASLKGGVGKTSTSINVAHAFAQRMCKTLLIDLDPTAHASKYFRSQSFTPETSAESPLARVFLSQDIINREQAVDELIDSTLTGDIPIISHARRNYDLIRGGSELRYFYWGRGARAFRLLFPALVDELKNTYDHIIIDTPPDFNVLLRNAVAVSDLVVVPVDASAMSIDCLEELVSSCAHITRPSWAIVRTMVNKSAVRVQELSRTRLEKKLKLSHREEELEETDTDYCLDSASDFVAMLHEREPSQSGVPARPRPQLQDGSPIYLLNSIVHRTEHQNRLSFLNKTAFDGRDTAVLSEEYLNVAREVEGLLSLFSDKDEALKPDNLHEGDWPENAFVTR